MQEVKIYRIIQVNPVGWKTTEEVINTLGAQHYSTLMSDKGLYRKFVAQLTDEEVIMAKLKFDVSIDILEGAEYILLKEQGYLDAAKIDREDTLRRLEGL